MIKILKEGRDISGIEYPNVVSRSCEDKLSVIFSSRKL
ncbi:MAG: hypothetical protein Sv326_0487 [Candidatus Fermentimicrarchaeum limneticum]|uniref:Uncharacterized protein n=1 Tax=Fermentimicrarchaeum limneticum TaxID=2795018 RepID=A0A7D6BNL8_FERL1|nr:MAG: hypothetical protein Sv326_0487 [Candidatus Fermentimicrarchaeum limneticum]